MDGRRIDSYQSKRRSDVCIGSRSVIVVNCGCVNGRRCG